MPRVCFEEKPVINTFYDDVEVCKRGGKKKKTKKTKPYISNVNKVIVNLTQGNNRRMTAPKQQFANQPKALQSVTYSNPIAPSHFDNRPASTHNNPMTIVKDTVEEKVPRSIPTFGALENPFGLCPADSRAQRATSSRTPVGGVLSSAPITDITQQNLAKAKDILKQVQNLPSYFPPAGRDNIPPPRQAEQDVAQPSNFEPLTAAQPESREVQMQRLSKIDYKIRTPREGDPSSRIKQKIIHKVTETGEEKAPFPRRVGRVPEEYLQEESKEDKTPSKKRGGSVF